MNSTAYQLLFSANLAFILTNLYGWLLKWFYLNAISCGKKNTTIKQLERIAEALGMPPTAGHFITAQSFWTSSSKVSLLIARFLTAER